MTVFEAHGLQVLNLNFDF